MKKKARSRTYDAYCEQCEKPLKFYEELRYFDHIFCSVGCKEEYCKQLRLPG